MDLCTSRPCWLCTRAISGHIDRADGELRSFHNSESHLSGDQSVDLLVTADGAMSLRGPRVQLDQPVHGTGCALSAAIACQLAVGRSLREACLEAKEFVAERLRAPVRPGRGRPSVM